MQCKDCNRPILTFAQALGKCVKERTGPFTVVKGQDYQDAFIISWGNRVQVENLFSDYGFRVLNRNFHQGIDVMHSGYKGRYLVSVQQDSTFKACYIDVLINDMDTTKAEKIIVSFHTPDIGR